MVNAIAWESPCSIIHTRSRNDLSVTQLLRKCRPGWRLPLLRVVGGGKAHRSHCNARTPVPFCRIAAR